MSETIDTPRSAAALLRFASGVAGIPNCSGDSSTRYALRRMSELATQIATEMQQVEVELVLAKRELRNARVQQCEGCSDKDQARAWTTAHGCCVDLGMTPRRGENGTLAVCRFIREAVEAKESTPRKSLCQQTCCHNCAKKTPPNCGHQRCERDKPIEAICAGIIQRCEGFVAREVAP